MFKKSLKSGLGILLIFLFVSAAGADAQSPERPGVWIAPVANVRISGGTTGSKTMLSVTANGDHSDLYGMDDRSGRQRWIFRRSPDGESYNIIVAGGTAADRRYLTAGQDGRKVNLGMRDDGSGRQRWTINAIRVGSGPIPRYKFQIMARSGVFPNAKYLSTSANGSVVDLYDVDDGSGRQNWVMDAPDGVRFNFRISGGISTGKIVLGKAVNGNSTELLSSISGSSGQQWVLTRWGFGVSYSMWTPSTGSGLFLTGSGNAPVGAVALAALGNTGDGGASARQDWIIEDIGSDLVRIKRASGDVLYLSATADGSTVDTFHRDDGSGRQRWRVSYASGQ